MYSTTYTLHEGVFIDLYSFDVIFPVFNAARTIERAALSFLDQGHPRLRVILVNDGSDDDSDAVCQGLARRYSNVVYTAQPNLGPNAARRAGFRLATADYVLFCDADDYVDGGLLRDLEAHLARTPSDVVEFGRRVVSEDGRLIYSHKYMRPETSSNCMDVYFMRRSFTGSSCNKVFRRAIMAAEDFTDLFYAEDACLVFNVYRKAASYSNICKDYYNYVENPLSSTHQRVTEKRLDSIRADQHIMGRLQEGTPWHACAAYKSCCRTTGLYYLFKSQDAMTPRIEAVIIDHFAQAYAAYTRRKGALPFLRMMTFKGWAAITLFHLSPDLYMAARNAYHSLSPHRRRPR